MIPTRLLTILAPGVSPVDAADTAHAVADTIVDESDVTFYRTFGPTHSTIVGDRGEALYKPPRQPGPVPLFDTTDDQTAWPPADRYFDTVDNTHSQLAAFDNALSTLPNHESTLPIAGALVTVALSKSVMRFLDAVAVSDQYTRGAVLEDELSAATSVNTPEWYLGSGDQQYHPDLPAGAVAGLSCDEVASQVFTAFEATTPYHHLWTHHHDPLTSFWGTEQVAAAYVLYGPITTMVVARDGEVTEYVIADDGERRTVTEGLTLPDDPVVYGFGGRVPDWTDRFAEYAREIERELKLRYGGAMIGDVNQVLTYGGVFGYPELESRPEGKLRLQFEANPMAYILDAAGGASSTGEESILEADAESLHERTPLYLGNEELIERLESQFVPAGDR